jgi:hypothetical protein
MGARRRPREGDLVTGIFYLYPNRRTPLAKQPLPVCWCRARAAYACADGVQTRPEYLCSVHAADWAQQRDVALPAPPPGEAA